MNLFSPEAFFDLSDEPAAGLFKGMVYAWEAVSALPAYIEAVIDPKVLGNVEEGAWLEAGRVQVGEGSVIERGAIIRGPSIIGRNTLVRSGAYIRGHVIVGNECLIGHGVEIRQILILNQSNIPHQNCVFTSLVGNRVNIGGHSSTSNIRIDCEEIVIKANLNDDIRSFPTGLTKFGAVIGDDSRVGPMCDLNPGAVIGRRCFVFPRCIVSGYIPHDSVVRPVSEAFEVVPRAEKHLSPMSAPGEKH